MVFRNNLDNYLYFVTQKSLKIAFGPGFSLHNNLSVKVDNSQRLLSSRKQVLIVCIKDFLCTNTIFNLNF